MNLIDTHCHLQFAKLAEQTEQVIDRAAEVGVKRMICVGTSIEDSALAVEIASKFDNVWATAGAHPHDGKNFDFQHDPAKLVELLKQPKVVAVGEIGLDFYKNYSPKLDQEKLLRSQIECGLPSGLPFVFHVREAFSDFWRIVDSYHNLQGVVHSFSSTPAELDQVLSRGLYVALNGIMTFTKDSSQLSAAKQVPMDRLLVETDAPFLAPAPHRGQLCEPKHVRDIVEFLADLRAEDPEKLAVATAKNAEGLFGL